MGMVKDLQAHRTCTRQRGNVRERTRTSVRPRIWSVDGCIRFLFGMCDVLYADQTDARCRCVAESFPTTPATSMAIVLGVCDGWKIADRSLLLLRGGPSCAGKSSND